MQPIKVTKRRMNAASTQPDVATRQRLAGVFDGITVSSHDIHRRQMRHPVVLYKAVGGRALDRCGQPQHGLELGIRAAAVVKPGNVVCGQRLITGHQNGQPNQFTVPHRQGFVVERQRRVQVVIGLHHGRRGDRQQSVVGQQIPPLGQHARQSLGEFFRRHRGLSLRWMRHA